MTDDKVEDFIDVDTFNKEVEAMRKKNGKVFEKGVKEYTIENYRGVIEDILKDLPIPSEMREGVIKGMMDMFKSLNIMGVMSPEEFKRIINSVILPHRRVNNPSFLTDIMGMGLGGSGNPFVFGANNDENNSKPQPIGPIKMTPQSMMKMVSGMFNDGEKEEEEEEDDVIKLSGKLGNGHISIEVTDVFTCEMAMKVLGELYTQFKLTSGKNVDKSAD